MLFPKIINRYTANFRTLPALIQKINSRNMIPIIDYANENTINYMKNYTTIYETVNNYPGNVFAVKFSSLGLNLNKINKLKEPTNIDQSYVLADNLIDLATNQKSTIMLDAEQDDIQADINSYTNNLIDKYNNKKPVVYKTYQMYRKDAFEILEQDMKTFKDHYLGIKLVRGAYYNTDYEKDVLYSDKLDTDSAYNEALKQFFANGNRNHYLVAATHNQESINLLMNLNEQYKNRELENNIAFAHLLGFSDNLSENLVQKKYRVYKYLPFGSYIDTFPYLLRRLYENYPMLMHLAK